MENEKIRGAVLLMGGFFIVVSVLEHYIFDNLVTDISPFLGSSLLTVLGLVCFYRGNKMLKK